MSRILMFSHRKVFSDGKTFGPSIRIWELARSLTKRGHEVTIVEKNRKKNKSKNKIKFINYDPKSIIKNIKKFDVVFIQIWFDDTHFLEKIKTKIPIVVDIYAPYLIEQAECDYETGDEFWRFIDDTLLSTLLTFRYGDYFICASERQRRYYLGMLASQGRINPYNKDKEIIGIVPFGVKKGKKMGRKKILRERIPKDKKIILWLSTFFNWLDPLETAKIMYELSKKSDEYVLAVVGAKSPFLYKKVYERNYNKFYKFVKNKKILDKSVFLFDYIDYADVPSIYNESELFITTYPRDSLETELAYRTRVSEAMYGRLPVIISGGDTIAELVKEYGTGIIIDNKKPKEVAESILKLGKEDIENMRENIKRFLSDHTWDKLVGPLDEFCRKPFIDRTKSKFEPNKLLDSRRELFLYLRDERDKRISQAEKLQEKSNKLNIKNIEYLEEIDRLNQELILMKNKESDLKEKQYGLKKLLIERDAEINDLIRTLEKLDKKVAGRDSIISHFRSSIVYPIYKITTTLGDTKVGKILQKLLK